MDFNEYRGKTVDDAITNACEALTVTSDKLEYEVIEKGSAGILGFGSKDAVIKARIKNDSVVVENKEVKETEKKEKKEFKVNSDSDVKPAQDPKEFLENVFKAMDMEVEITSVQKGNEINIELAGPDMGVLIGKRGQ
ncbi:MAG: Jag N-terminal domain-containing protein, partial [Lachnospiraceae bacterium]|nr:Jag N-terminal domain-containing protein [Lachnospiraceae bacterium]